LSDIAPKQEISYFRVASLKMPCVLLITSPSLSLSLSVSRWLVGLPDAFRIYKLNSAQVGDLGGAIIIAVDVTLGDILEIDKAKGDVRSRDYLAVQADR